MTPSAEHEVIDMRVANQLIAHRRMGQSAFERLVPVFLEEAGMLTEQIRCAIAAADWEGLRLTAHKLKGGASVIGAAEVRSLSQNLMAQVDAQDYPGADIVQAIEQAVGRFKTMADGLTGR